MNDWLRKDLKYNWHPYTQMSRLEVEPPLLIERAEGVKLYDGDGRWYYDAISSWWCNVHGHSHQRIREAIEKQMRELDHVLFAAVTHRPAIDLSERLVGIVPPGLERVFYSDDGSTAVEVALKMSLQHWRNRGRPEKCRFICLEPGYHGDTIGCMSVSGVKSFRRAFGSVMFDSLGVPAPCCFRCPMGLDREQCSLECLDLLEKTVSENADTVAALIMEPLLLAAGGMIVYPAEYLRRAAELAHRCGVQLILDEVATGFGRTGTMFACEQAEVSPDFLCLSKGLTSGTMPLAATLTTGEVYDSFLGEAGGATTFYHGHTYTANPIGCAAALASLSLFEEEGTLSNVHERAGELAEAVRPWADLPHVADVRNLGMVAAAELVREEPSNEPLPAWDPLLRSIYRGALDNHLLLRPLGNVVYLYPPLCVSADELADMAGRAFEVLAQVLA